MYCSPYITAYWVLLSSVIYDSAIYWMCLSVGFICCLCIWNVNCNYCCNQQNFDNFFGVVKYFIIALIDKHLTTELKELPN